YRHSCWWRYEVIRMDEEVVLGREPEHLVRGRLEIDRLTFPVRDEEVAREAALRFQHGLDRRAERALRQHMAPDDGIGDALTLAVLLALEMVTGDRDAGVV